MYKQSLITILLTVLMSMTGAKTFAYDIEVANDDGVTIYYVWINNNTELAVSHHGVSESIYTGNVTIPKSVKYKGNTYPVTSIGEQAFYGCSALTSVTIPNSITSISSLAFYRCSALTYIIIPNSVTSIGRAAFYDCSSLKSITIPNSVTSVDEKAFDNTMWYDKQPDGLVYLGKVAYKYKGKMPENTHITIQEGTAEITHKAFQDCSGLTSVTIPNSVTSIGEAAFLKCNNLTSIAIPSSIKKISRSAFMGCSSLTSVAIPNSVTSIGTGAFYGCSGLTSVIIPNSVTSIGFSAFYDCTSLTSVHISDLGAWCKISFDGYLGSNPLYHAHHLYLDGVEIKDLVIPDNVTSISEYAFHECTELVSVTIPNSVTTICDFAFCGCTGLTSITIPNSVKYLSGFTSCIGLTSVNIANSVTSIGDYAFCSCSGLTTIIIPNSVTSIGDVAFEECNNLTSITIPNSVTSIGVATFSNCSGLTSILCLNDTPPTCSPNSFYNINKENCVLWVPKGSVNAYKEADGWKDFQIIRELMFGDVNIDFEVNQADLDATVGFIMDKAPEGFYENLADLNGDDVVDAADVVKLVTIKNIHEGLSMDYQAKYSNQVISSLSCTMNNDGDKAILLTKCELYFNESLVGSSKFKVTLASGGSKKCSFDELESLSSRTGFSVVWYYTYNEEEYTYRCEITE